MALEKPGKLGDFFSFFVATLLLCCVLRVIHAFDVLILKADGRTEESPDKSDSKSPPVLSPHVTPRRSSEHGSGRTDDGSTGAPPSLTPHATTSAAGGTNESASSDTNTAKKTVSFLRKLFGEQSAEKSTANHSAGSEHSASRHSELVTAGGRNLEKTPIQYGTEQSDTVISGSSISDLSSRKPASSANESMTEATAADSRIQLEGFGAEGLLQKSMNSEKAVTLVKLSMLLEKPDISKHERCVSDRHGKRTEDGDGLVKVQSGGQKKKKKIRREISSTDNKVEEEQRQMKSQTGSKSRMHTAENMSDHQSSTELLLEKHISNQERCVADRHGKKTEDGGLVKVQSGSQKKIKKIRRESSLTDNKVEEEQKQMMKSQTGSKSRLHTADNVPDRQNSTELLLEKQNISDQERSVSDRHGKKVEGGGGLVKVQSGSQRKIKKIRRESNLTDNKVDQEQKQMVKSQTGSKSRLHTAADNVPDRQRSKEHMSDVVTKKTRPVTEPKEVAFIASLGESSSSDEKLTTQAKPVDGSRTSDTLRSKKSSVGGHKAEVTPGPVQQPQMTRFTPSGIHASSKKTNSTQVAKHRDDPGWNVRIIPLDPRWGQQPHILTNVFVSAAGGDGLGSSTGSKNHSSCVTPLDPRLANRQQASELSRELSDSRSSAVDSEVTSSIGDRSGSKFQTFYRIPLLGNGRRKEVVPDLEEKQPGVAVKMPRRDAHHSEQRSHHRHRRHHERVRVGPHGKPHRRQQHTASGASKSAQAHHRQVVTHRTESTPAASCSGSQKPKAKVISLSDYKERRKQNMDDQKNSAAESLPPGDGTAKESELGCLKLSLAEELLQSLSDYQERRKQNMVDLRNSGTESLPGDGTTKQNEVDLRNSATESLPGGGTTKKNVDDWRNSATESLPGDGTTKQNVDDLRNSAMESLPGGGTTKQNVDDWRNSATESLSGDGTMKQNVDDLRNSAMESLPGGGTTKQNVDEPSNSATESLPGTTKESDLGSSKLSLTEELLKSYNTGPHVEPRLEMLLTGGLTHDTAFEVDLAQNIKHSGSDDDDDFGDVLESLLDIFGASSGTEITGVDIFQDTDVSNTETESMARTAEGSSVEPDPVCLAKYEKETEQNEVDLPEERVRCPSESGGNEVTEHTAITQVASVESAEVEQQAGEPELFEEFTVEQAGSELVQAEWIDVAEAATVEVSCKQCCIVQGSDTRVIPQKTAGFFG